MRKLYQVSCVDVLLNVSENTPPLSLCPPTNFMRARVRTRVHTFPFVSAQVPWSPFLCLPFPLNASHLVFLSTGLHAVKYIFQIDHAYHSSFSTGPNPFAKNDAHINAEACSALSRPSFSFLFFFLRMGQRVVGKGGGVWFVRIHLD